MPSTYAHYKFGQLVLRNLREDIMMNIINNKPLYDIGLHGPDILFYYKPLYRNSVNQTGFGMHDQKANLFFERAREVIRNSHTKTRSLAYVLGFICHFVLDSECHGYIEEKIQKSGISHTEIEVEFDRMLMVYNNHNPLKHRLTNHIIPKIQYAETIAPFFENVSAAEVQKSLKSMIRYNNLLIAPGKMKRKMIYALLRATGNYEDMHGLIVNFKSNKACTDSCNELEKRFAAAIDLAVCLIEQYSDNVRSTEPLNTRFNRTFGVDKSAEENVEAAPGYVLNYADRFQKKSTGTDTGVAMAQTTAMQNAERKSVNGTGPVSQTGIAGTAISACTAFEYKEQQFGGSWYE